MAKLVADEKRMDGLKELRDSLNLLIEVYEKDESKVTEEEIERATGKFLMACIALENFK